MITFSELPDEQIRHIRSYGLHGPGFNFRLGQNFSPQRPYRLWTPPSLLYNGYEALFSLR
jgi:hypothetical protein